MFLETTKIHGIVSRLEEGIGKFQHDIKLNIVTFHDGEFLTWRGAVKMAFVDDSFEYDEIGPNIVQRKCF